MASRHAQGGKQPNLGWRRTGPQHALGYRISHRLLSGIVMAVIAALAFSGTFAAATLADISRVVDDNKIQVIAQDDKDDDENQLVDPYANEPIDILLIGQDTRDGDTNAAIGGGETEGGLHNSDTVMILQLAADRKSANLVSLPRDLIVDVPACQTTTGTIPAQYSVMLNTIFPNAYAQGGDLASAASCTMSMVNSLSGMNIQNFMVVDFGGLVNMINAIGGVDICIPVDTVDSYTGLNLAKGVQHLDGLTATQYARMRHGTGTDGSDTMRTTRQQYLIKRLITTALQKNLITQTAQLYQLAKSALESVQMSSGLADVMTLAGLAMSMKDFNVSHLYSQTIPIVPWTYDANRSMLADGAEAVWEKLRNHQPLVEEQSTDTTTDGGATDGTTTGDGATTDGGATDGTTADGGSTDGGATGDGSTYNERTGVITMADGTLIDAETGGTIDPETGAIRDAVTGQFIGLANRYLEIDVCGMA
ncbi:LCP family protein [Bifidobacterium samirii]|uniref:Transcriptional regulator n=1 Tax=Bifidobacterium samirii TaxID=2306974 RepID=A0A430FWK0_9BIFI|nr:LCP family protein [Bifidobacterium samirii]RSX58495.1 transcriptional regulator [Bifidobacterium samirii]